MARLDGKIALVSGGARGMGASHVKKILENGGKVVFGDVLDEEGKALAEELGNNATYVHLDVTNYEDWEKAVDTAVKQYGGLNILVNNAGIFDNDLIEDFSIDRWDRIISINLTGVYFGMKAAAEAMKKSAPAAIVNISSINGLIGTPGSWGYVASKFGVRGLTKVAAGELGPFGIRANSIHPGVIETPMTAGLDTSGITSPLNRAGKPEEVSNLVLFLASDESSYSNGAEFVIDGGGMATTAPVTADEKASELAGAGA